MANEFGRRVDDMIVHGVVSEKHGKLAGKPYSLDTRSDTLYVVFRSGESAYSEFQSFAGDLYLVDFDKDGNILGYSFENVLETVARTGFIWRVRVWWTFLQVAVLPARAAAKLVQGIVQDALSSRKIKLEIATQGVAG